MALCWDMTCRTLDRWGQVSNIFLPQIWGEVVLVTRPCCEAVKLTVFMPHWHVSRIPYLWPQPWHSTIWKGFMMNIRWSVGTIISLHDENVLQNSQVQTLPNQIRSRELWQELVMIVLSCPHPTLGCVLCTTRPGQTQLCAAEIRGAVCQRYISFVYSLV